MSNNKKIIIISMIFVIIIVTGVIIGVNIFTKNEADKTAALVAETKKGKSLESLTEVEKEILGVEDTTDEKEEEKYSDLYKEYLELSDEEKEELEVVPRKDEVPFEKLDEIKDNLEDIEDEDGIPARFNLGEVINIRIDDQGSYGLCWGFASLNTLETYLALNNLGEYDFSEIHLDYIESENLYGNRTLHEGGSFENFQNYVIESGVVLEETVPYSTDCNYTEEEYTNFIEMEHVVEVTETVDFPSLYKNEYSNHTEEEIEEFRDTVKKHIMTNGGLYTTIVSDAGINHYTAPDTYEWTDHAVTIVGWDDNYSKDNFLSVDGKKPSKDGAYIAVNSWGEYSNDNGYYYISYEDKYVESNLSGIASVSMESAYKIDSIKNEEIKKLLKERYSHLFIEYNGEEYITKNAISRIYELDLSNKNITSIDGIEMFSNLQYLNLSNNNIKDLEPLTKINTLVEINLSNNNLTNINEFKNMTLSSIYLLNLSNNQIKDVSPLSNLKLELYSLDISNNTNVTGLEKLKNIWSLNASNCNITDVEMLKNMTDLAQLNLSYNTGISGLEYLPESVITLNISNCDFTEVPNITDNILCINISNNQITDLNGIQNIPYLNEIDVSGNPITNWEALKEIQVVISEEYMSDGLFFVANNCNIEDITIFNDIQIYSLELKNNKLTDISQFNNEYVSVIDLSNNEGLTGLSSLNKVYTIFLDNCNLTDLEEVSKLESVYDLSLENNEITDTSKLSELKNLMNLSLAGNKNLTNIFSSENLYIINLSNCNLNNEIDFSNIPNLAVLNVLENPELTDVSRIVNNMSNDYVSLMVDEITYSDLEKIKESKYVDIEKANIILDYELAENESEINLDSYRAIKNDIRKNFVDSSFIIENGEVNKKGNIIKITDLDKESVNITFEGWNSNFPNATIKIMLKHKEEDNTSENMEAENEVIIENNVIEENIVL